jgi:hypothetical protein
MSKISLPDIWRDRFLDKLKEWGNENRQTSDLFAQNLKKKIEGLKIKISRLTDAYLAGFLNSLNFSKRKRFGERKENFGGEIIGF